MADSICSINVLFGWFIKIRAYIRLQHSVSIGIPPLPFSGQVRLSVLCLWCQGFTKFMVCYYYNSYTSCFLDGHILVISLPFDSNYYCPMSHSLTGQNVSSNLLRSARVTNHTDLFRIEGFFQDIGV